MASSHSQPSPHSPLASETLCEADCAAMEALIHANFDVSLVEVPHRERAERLVKVMGLACSCPGVKCCPTLAERTLAKVGGTSSLNITATHQPDQLEWEDEEAVDAYVMSGYRIDRVPSSLRERARKLENLGKLFNIGNVTQSTNFAELSERTLATVARTPMNTPEQVSIAGRIGGMRLADIFSVAAVAVLGVSVLWPVLSTLRGHSMRAVCGDNMRAIASAMGAYAGDYRDSLPVASASLAGPTWWDVGTTPSRSNSANLFQLPKLHYASLADFACPGNISAQRSGGCEGKDDWGCRSEVSYSYQVMFGETRPRWGEKSTCTMTGAAPRGAMPMIVLTDKSPVVMRATSGQKIYADENSTNHAGDGQFALRADGSAAWLSSPQVGDDNIWLPCAMDRALVSAKAAARSSGARGGVIEITLTGNELSRQRGNTFVGP